MRRRGVGVAAVKHRAREKDAFEVVGQAAAAENMAHVQATLETFKGHLEDFARKYKKSINQDPAFRQQFQTMCASIGGMGKGRHGALREQCRPHNCASHLDPLASNKGFWAEVLGVGDFYYELAVQITEVCIATRETNGGLMALQELLQRLRARRSKKSPAISLDDIKRAIAKLKVLGRGFALVEVGKTQMVLSVPRELSNDASAVLQAAEGSGHASVRALCVGLSWTQDRARRALTALAQDGMAWVDEQAPGGEPLFFFPSLWKGEHLLGGGAEGGEQ
ncbi:EAP30/Vps36 family-domain-containing protein [Tribonema minus]|uniref:EAP30/Vps36 family-domain-containing protein n=1 Tax=Tribonema minus TaxID=303371 RepID=A0A835YIN3_9STRA|nr:EAP30/Vps36 family-domain-containing protein [Tribonema minus]